MTTQTRWRYGLMALVAIILAIVLIMLITVEEVHPGVAPTVALLIGYLGKSLEQGIRDLFALDDKTQG